MSAVTRGRSSARRTDDHVKTSRNPVRGRAIGLSARRGDRHASRHGTGDVPFRLRRSGMMMASRPVGAIGRLHEKSGARREEKGRGDESRRHDQGSIARINETTAAKVAAALSAPLSRDRSVPAARKSSTGCGRPARNSSAGSWRAKCRASRQNACPDSAAWRRTRSDPRSLRCRPTGRA
jgi:hypothetical protein